MHTRFTIIILAVFVAYSESCPIGFWGSDCSNECHCALSDGSCRKEDGLCPGGTCRRGYTGFDCQTPCPEGTYGDGCSSTCHCPEGDQCNHVNGLCSSETCQEGWGGAGCKIRYPVFSGPPNITSVSITGIEVSWRPWDNATDPGDPPLAQYELQYKESSEITWKTHATIAVVQPEPAVYRQHVSDVSPVLSYQFRLALARWDVGKLDVSFPGPATAAVKVCSEPSAAAIIQWVTQQSDNDGNLDITVAWEAPPPNTSGCSSVKYHQVSLHCVGGACASRTALILMPQVTYTFKVGRIDTDMEVQVIPVNDAGQYGPTASLLAKITTSSSSAGTTNGNTNQQTPSTVTDIECLAAAENSLEMTWPVGQASTYAVAVTVNESYSNPQLTGQLILQLTISSSYLLLQSLHHATYYSFRVTSNDDPDPYMMRVWTLPKQPPVPPTPEVLAVGTSTATIRIKPLTMDTGPLTAYQVVVMPSAGSSASHIRARRYTSGTISNMPGSYVTAELQGETLSTGVVFTVGDGKTYSGYLNKPLQTGTEYKSWLFVISELAGVRKENVVEVQGEDGFSFKTVGDVEPVVSKVEEKSKGDTAVIAIVCFLALLCLVCFICYVVKVRGWHREVMPFVRTAWVAGRSKLQQVTSRSPSGGTSTSHVADQSSTRPTAAGSFEDFFKRSVSVGRLASHYDTLKQCDGALRKEFQRLPSGLSSTVHAARMVQNVDLNRSRRSLPYDSNRVRLYVKDDCGNDYINATLLSCQRLHFIVSAWPMSTTVAHFWQMVWEQRVWRVVSLLDTDNELTEDAGVYWPPLGHFTQHGKLHLSLITEERRAYYVIRQFDLRHEDDNEVRSVYQFQYTGAWQRSEVPVDAVRFLEFLQCCRLEADQTQACVVQCLTGNSRSGLYVAVQLLIEEALATGRVDIFSRVSSLRRERAGLVKTFAQYNFIYEALLALLARAKTRFDAASFPSHYYDLVHIAQGCKTNIELEFRQMLADGSQGTEMDRFKSPTRLHAEFAHQVGLTGSTIVDYPPLAVLDSFTQRYFYVILRRPSDYNAGCFWNVVLKLNCVCLVRIADPDEDNSSFFPQLGERRTYGNATLRHLTTSQHSENLLQRNLELTVREPNQEPQTAEVTVFHLYWPDKLATPRVKAMLDAYQMVDLHVKQRSASARVGVVHSLGAGRGALFCLSSILLDKMSFEGAVDIFHETKHLRSSLPQAVLSLEEYIFCYKLVNRFVSGDDRSRSMQASFHLSQDFTDQHM